MEFPDTSWISGQRLRHSSSRSIETISRQSSQAIPGIVAAKIAGQFLSDEEVGESPGYHKVGELRSPHPASILQLRGKTRGDQGVHDGLDVHGPVIRDHRRSNRSSDVQCHPGDESELVLVVQIEDFLVEGVIKTSFDLDEGVVPKVVYELHAEPPYVISFQG